MKPQARIYGSTNKIRFTNVDLNYSVYLEKTFPITHNFAESPDVPVFYQSQIFRLEKTFLRNDSYCCSHL